jgi:hypothetical protein
MDPDEYDALLHQHTQILASLARTMAHQAEGNADIRATLGELRTITVRLDATLARVTALMERVFGPQGGNGQEAR